MRNTLPANTKRIVAIVINGRDLPKEMREKILADVETVVKHPML